MSDQEESLEIEVTRSVAESRYGAVGWGSTVAWKSAAIGESRSADIPKLGSTVAVGANGSSVAVISSEDGKVFVSHDWVLATWT